MEWRTVEKNIGLPAEIGHVSDVKEKETDQIEKLLSITGLKEFRRHYPPQLSVGMKNRVALARALLLVPEVLLLDEPLAGLDLLTRTELLPEISRVLYEYRCTTVIVTHSIDEAVFWGTKLILLSSRPGTILETILHSEPLPRKREYSESLEFQTMVARCRQTVLKSVTQDDNG